MSRKDPYVMLGETILHLIVTVALISFVIVVLSFAGC